MKRMNVELMTIEATLKMIQKAKDIYSGDYEDIDIVHGGERMHVTLGQMEADLLDYKDTIYIEGNEVIRIGGHVAINEYEFLSSDCVNVYAITEFIDF